MKSIQKVFIEKEKKKKPIWRNEIGMALGFPCDFLSSNEKIKKKLLYD